MSANQTTSALVKIPLWEGPVPGNKDHKPEVIPTLTVYKPASGKANRTAVVIFPGGAYEFLADYEGKDYAEYLNQLGITCFVLQYRLGSEGYRHPVQLWDAARAVRYVRTHAAKHGIDPNRIGVMGSSAGGHLAATLMTHFDAGNPQASDPIDRVSSRPDFGILCYPVITMGELSHGGSRRNLLGENPSAELIEELSTETRVTPETPPTFIFHTYADDLVPAENSLQFALSLGRNKVPYALHIYQDGPHGVALGRDGTGLHPWLQDLLVWLKTRKLV